MTSMVEKKFKSFEINVRENLKERTLASKFYQGIPTAETDKFMVFYLSIILKKLDTMKREAAIDVPDTDRPEPRLGYMTAVPVPAGGIAAIKVGEVPDLDLDEIIHETLLDAIKKYLNAVRANPEILRKLPAEADLMEITDTMIEDIYVPPKNAFENLRSIFHICDYLTQKNNKFISNFQVENIKTLHNAFVNKIFDRFPSLGDDEGVPENWLNIRMGIIPIGVNPDLPTLDGYSYQELLSNFRDGDAAQFLVTSFNIKEVDDLIKAVDNIYSNLSPYIQNYENIDNPLNLVSDTELTSCLNILNEETWLGDLCSDIKNLAVHIKTSLLELQEYYSLVYPQLQIPLIENDISDPSPTRVLTFAEEFDKFKKKVTAIEADADWDVPNEWDYISIAIYDKYYNCANDFYTYLESILASGFVKDFIDSNIPHFFNDSTDNWSNSFNRIFDAFRCTWVTGSPTLMDWMRLQQSQDGITYHSLKEYIDVYKEVERVVETFLEDNSRFLGGCYQNENLSLGSMEMWFDMYNKNKDSYPVVVNSDWISDNIDIIINNWTSSGYTVISYNETLICYKTPTNESSNNG